MPTNRASMPQKIVNRRNALSAYITTNNIAPTSGGMLGELTTRFSSFANTVQTRINSSNGTVSALGGTLEAQVDRALSETLRQPGAGVATISGPQQGESSVAALVGGSGGIQPIMSPYQAALLREARITQADFLAVIDSLQPLSPFTDPGDVASLQALLRAEVNALLEEFSYRTLLPRQQRVRVLLGGLLGWNFIGGSPFAPGAPAGDINAFVALLNLGGPLIPTIQVEDQLASQQVLGTDGALFDAQWFAFWTSALQGRLAGLATPITWQLWEPGLSVPPVASGLGNLLPLPPGAGTPQFPLGPQSPGALSQAPWQVAVFNIPTPRGPSQAQSYAERMIQADLLLPVIAQDAGQVESAMEAIGYSRGEQETSFVEFWSGVDSDLLPPLAGPPSWWTVLNGSTPPGAMAANPNLGPTPVYMTVADILDWAQNLVGPNSGDLLRQAGALGLNLMCDQADELFWLALAMLDPTASAQIPALADSEVQLEVASLATDLNSFANLAY
jgi:hypothetical protein